MTLALLSAAALLAGPAGAEASTRLGAALHGADSSACVTFAGAALRAGDRVLVFLFSPPRVVDGWIRARSAAACNAQGGSAAASYEVRLRHPISDLREVGVAVHDSSARVEYAEGEFVVYTRAAPHAPLRFRQCASQEGLHLTAWRQSRRVWHEYWYLGMDLEPDCTDRDVAD